MPTLHLLHQGAKLRLRAGRLLLEAEDGGRLLSVPARKVRRVVVHGNVGFTTPALVFLLKNRATIAFVSMSGGLYGLASSLPWPAPDRIARQLAFEGTAPALELARTLVRAKLSSQVEYLRRQGVPSASLEWGRELLSRLRQASSLDGIRGLEGLGSRLYFQELGRLSPDLGFDGRRRRPPRDPVNAALSYAYTLLLGVATSAVMHAGLHPEIGVLHATGRRRPSLALDLMEELRPLVGDSVVLTLLNKGEVKEGHFVSRADGCNLTSAGRKAVLRAYERRLREEIRHPLFGYRVTWRRVMEVQARVMARWVLGEASSYVPMVTR